MDTRWALDEEKQEDGMRHIYPCEDNMLHTLIGFLCSCSPTIDIEYDLVIHNRCA